MVLVRLWRSCHPETTEVGNGGRWWYGADEVVVAVGCAFANTKWGRRLGSENPKLSHCGLVPGLPCQTVMLGGGGWWWCVSLEVAAVTGIVFANLSGGKGV